MSTEDVDQRFVDLDSQPTACIMDVILESQLSAVASIQDALPNITEATEIATVTLGETGRILYAGAGTSGRVAVQDGTELLPTFNWPNERIGFVLAGGLKSLTHSQEGAEDDSGDAERQIDALALTAADVVIGIAASGTTSFTVAAIRQANKYNSLTIGIANNADTPLLKSAKFPIHMETGSEIIAGSTRMGAGTSQKVVLNMISTGIMIKLGYVYNGLMVDMRVSNKKLLKRAIKMVSQITDCDALEAAIAIDKANGDIKLASLLALGCPRILATEYLQQSTGNLRQAIMLMQKRVQPHESDLKSA